jgi:hypothetical protein
VALTCSPVLAAWRRLGWPLRLATYLPILRLVVYERNVTGTNPELAFALSPWPVVQILGLELVAAAIAALELGVALGLAGLSRGPVLAGLGVLATAGFPLASLAAGSASGLLPFKAGRSSTPRPSPASGARRVRAVEAARPRAWARRAADVISAASSPCCRWSGRRSRASTTPSRATSGPSR